MGFANWVLDPINWILNLAALLLWLNWRSSRFDPLAKTAPATLAGTLKRAGPYRLPRWLLLLVLGTLILVRGMLYWGLGRAIAWVPNLQIGPIAIAFRADFWARAVVFSVLSFGQTLGLFYVWLLGLSLVNGQTAELDPIQRLVRVNLGPVDRWPWWIKLALPLVVAALAWLALNPLLAHLGLLPPARSVPHRLEQGLVIGLIACLTWRYAIGVVLALYLLNSYVFLGQHAFLSFVALTGRNLLVPLRRVPLRVGRVDLAPVLMIAVVFLPAEFMRRRLTWH